MKKFHLHCKRTASLTGTLTILFLTFLSIGAGAQSWITVGSPDFSSPGAYYSPLALDTGGTPYVLFFGDLVGTGNVVRDSAATWVGVGAANFSTQMFTLTGSFYPAMAIDPQGNPWIAYPSYNNGALTVMKYNGSSWIGIGDAGSISGQVVTTQADFISMAIDSAGTPYVAFADEGDVGALTVMAYIDSAWTVIGAPDFTISPVNYTSITFDRNGTPYVAYTDGQAANSGTCVMKFNGTDWVLVGAAGFSGGFAQFTSIAIDPSNTPYVAYTDCTADDNYSYQSTVMKYVGGSWVLAGNAGISVGATGSNSLVIDNYGKPYLAFGDLGVIGSYDNRAVVKTLEGDTWVSVGAAAVSPGPVSYPYLAINSTGMLYLSFADSLDSFKTTVMEYQTPESIPAVKVMPVKLAVYPDPTDGSFTVHVSSAINETATISITNILGETVKQCTTATNTDVPVQLTSPPGMYFISATTGTETVTSKVVVR